MLTKFSQKEVCEIAAITQLNLERWIAMGLLGYSATRLKPQYTLSEVIAIAVCAVYRREGAMFERCVGVATYLAGMPVEHLEAELAAGRTFPVPAAFLAGTSLPGLMIEPPDTKDRAANSLMARLDLKKIFDDVMRQVDRPAKPKRKQRKHRKVAH